MDAVAEIVRLTESVPVVPFVTVHTAPLKLPLSFALLYPAVFPAVTPASYASVPLVAVALARSEFIALAFPVAVYLCVLLS